MCVCDFVCVCVFLFLSLFEWLCVFVPAPLLHVCVHTYACTCSQYVPCLPLARGPVLPLGRPAISPFILSKTSKLPSSTVHEGAALCLMSLLFCSDLPPPKPHSTAVIHSSRDNGEALWRKNIWSMQEQRSPTTCWIKAHLCRLFCTTGTILSFNYYQQFSLKDPTQPGMHNIQHQPC